MHFGRQLHEHEIVEGLGVFNGGGHFSPTYSRLVSSIKLPASVEDEVVQRGRQGAQAVKLLAGLDEHVFGDAQATQTAVRPSHALDRRFVALRHDDEQVQIAAFVRRAPGVRTEKPDALGMEFVREPVRDFIQKGLVNCLHRTKRSTACGPTEVLSESGSSQA